MLTAIMEILLSALAAVGLAFIVWLITVRRLLPLSDKYGIVFTVVRGVGSGDGLEQRVRELLWLRRWNLLRGNILVVDCGLNEDGRALARLLCANTDEVLLCDQAQFSEMIFDT